MASSTRTLLDQSSDNKLFLEENILKLRGEMDEHSKELDRRVKQNEKIQSEINRIEKQISTTQQDYEDATGFFASMFESNREKARNCIRMKEQLLKDLKSKQSSKLETTAIEGELKKNKKKLIELEEEAKNSKQPIKGWIGFPRELNKQTKKKYMEFFENKLPKYTSGFKYINLLLIGGVGSGKSSFINTCATALADKGTFIPPSKVLPASSTCVTKELHPYSLKTQNGKQLPVHLFDCRGLSDDVKAEPIELALEGSIKPVATIESVEEMQQKDEIITGPIDIMDTMHVIIFVLKADSNLHEKGGSLDEIKKIKKRMDGKAFNPFVLLTSIDEIGVPNDDIVHIYQYDCTKRYCKKVANILDLPLNFVVPMSNYFEEGLPTDAKDTLALSNLWLFVNAGIEMLQTGIETRDMLNSKKVH